MGLVVKNSIKCSLIFFLDVLYFRDQVTKCLYWVSKRPTIASSAVKEVVLVFTIPNPPIYLSQSHLDQFQHQTIIHD